MTKHYQTTLEDYIPVEDNHLPEVPVDTTQAEDAEDKVTQYQKFLRKKGISDRLIARSTLSFVASVDYNIKEGPVRPDNMMLHPIAATILDMHYKKEGSYGSSWCKRGQQGVFFNIAKKFDRLENIILKEGTDEVGETIADTVADLATYSILWLSLIAETQPQVFKEWMASVNLGEEEK